MGHIIRMRALLSTFIILKEVESSSLANHEKTSHKGWTFHSAGLQTYF